MFFGCRQPEPQPGFLAGERAREDPGLGQALEHRGRARMVGEAEQRRAADQLQPRAHQEIVELTRLHGKPTADHLLPVCVGKRRRANGERRAADGPRPKTTAQLVREARRRDGKAEPQASEAVEFAKRAQHNHARRQVRHEAGVGLKRVHESFVDDECADVRCRCSKRRGRKEATIGIVGVDDDRDVGAGEIGQVRNGRTAAPAAKTRSYSA